MAISKEKYVPNYSEATVKKVAKKALIEESAEEASKNVSVTPDGPAPTDADATATNPDTARTGA